MNSHNHRSTSEALIEIVDAFPSEEMTLQDLMDGLGERSFGFVLLLFGVLSAIAIVPGLATVTAIPLLFFGLQMFVGYRTPWLPKFISERSFAKADLLATIKRAVPAMRWVEKICKPRLLFLTGRFAERLLGLLVFILAAVIALPGPGTNFMPGVAIAFMAIAIIERDGLMVLIGMLVSAFALYLGYLGLHLVITEVLPWVWEHTQQLWKSVAGAYFQ
ncbi:MAG: exopolysaccharide biosynthesis protein [Micropepsaceae bacterium]